MRKPAVVIIALSLVGTAPFIARRTAADPAAPNTGQVYVRVEHLTGRMEFLSAEVQGQLRDRGLATGKSMANIRVQLAVGITSGRASVVDSYQLTVPSGASVQFAPTSRNRVGLKVAVAPQGETLDATVEFSYAGRTVRKTLATSSGVPAAVVLVPEGIDSGGPAHLALLTLTRVPPPASP